MAPGVGKMVICPICHHEARSDAMRRHVLSKHAAAFLAEVVAPWERVTDTMIAKKRKGKEAEFGKYTADRYCAGVCLTCGTISDKVYADKEAYKAHVCHEKVERPHRRKEKEEAESNEEATTPCLALWDEARTIIMTSRPAPRTSVKALQDMRVKFQELFADELETYTVDDVVDYKKALLAIVADLTEMVLDHLPKEVTNAKHMGFEVSVKPA